MTDSNAPDQASWMKLVARYQTPDHRRSVLQLVNSFVPFVLLWYAMFRSLEVGYWLTLLLAIPAAGFLVRIFIIQHDCGHGSFFKSKRLAERVGFVCGVLTLTPYAYWRRSHAIHHAGASNLAKRGIGDIKTLTIDEYRSLSRWGRLQYRLYRHPLVMFVVGPVFNFAVLNRLWFGDKLIKEQASVHWTNLTIVGVATALTLLLGFKTFLMVHVPIMVLSSSAGVWLFYVQHQFERTYWAEDESWDYARAALEGSSFYRLPAVLRWFTGNIGFHHIHHLSPRIPNYKLRQCHEENPEFQRAPQLTVASSLRTAGLRLWDVERQRMVGFGELRNVA